MQDRVVPHKAGALVGIWCMPVAESMTPERPAPYLTIGVLLIIAAMFCVRNIPWHLDDFDQAKQAFTSFEMVKEGHWWYQHTPSGMIATKPPLAGWMAAVWHFVLG